MKQHALKHNKLPVPGVGQQHPLRHSVSLRSASPPQHSQRSLKGIGYKDRIAEANSHFFIGLLLFLFHTVTYCDSKQDRGYTVAYGGKLTRKTKLTTADWVGCGFRTLAANGPQSLKAEVLAKTLKVTKGSFYWHFKDITALKVAILDRWEELVTQQITAQVDAGSLKPKQHLYNLIETALCEVSQEYETNGVSNALRNWAQFDDLALAYVSKVDMRRLEYLEKLFSQVPQTKRHAKINAQILCAILIGADQLEAAETKACLQHALDIMIGGNRPIPA